MNNDGYAISGYYKGRGILEICDGAVVSNVVNIGYVDTENDRAKNCMCHGSLFVRGGVFDMVRIWPWGRKAGTSMSCSSGKTVGRIRVFLTPV